MAQKKDKIRTDLIDSVEAMINKKLPADQAKLIKTFASMYLGTVAVDDLLEHRLEDLYGIVLSQWNLLYQRQPKESKIRIFNPHVEQDSWQSTHTIVEVTQEDMPFLVDSLRMQMDDQGFTVHLIIHMGGMKLRRNAQHQVIEVLPFDAPMDEGVTTEAPIYIEIDKQTDSAVLQDLEKNLRLVLKDVCAAVEDWPKMRQKARQVIEEVTKEHLNIDAEEHKETIDFLRWLEDDHFTFLGYRDYEIVDYKDEVALRVIPDSGLGVLADTSKSTQYRTLSSLPPEARSVALSRHPLIISKTNTKATVHRPVYTDYIGVKRFNEKGEVVGEHRFLGLYTSVAYTSNPKQIPFVRRKVEMIMQNSGLSPKGHAGKALLNILETLPRDDLFQASTETLAELAMGILHLQERKRIRLFARKDVYGHFISCLVYVPRERFTTELGLEMQNILQQAFQGLDISFTTWFSDSVLARLHFVVRIDPNTAVDFDLKEIEQKLIEVGRSWIDELRENLLEFYGEEKGNVQFQMFEHAFTAAYREAFSARTAVHDIERIQKLSEQQPLTMSFYRSAEEMGKVFRLKLFNVYHTIPLSDVMPIFENLGLRVISERPYQIRMKGRPNIWINDFGIEPAQDVTFDIEVIKEIFQSAFISIWNGHAENDRFNSLVVTAQLSWREIAVLRAYSKYLRQTGFIYSQTYIENTFAKYPVIAKLLVRLFLLRFDPAQSTAAASLEQLQADIEKRIDEVVILDEDRILRRMLEVMLATLRTNYFQTDKQGNAKLYFSFKLNPYLISELPLPLPQYEIFVYSPRLEGVHLRTSKVARGGIRWSDRREDFRTEILGLMKAQNVKNAVIVPSGAKGGFVTKCLPAEGSREEIMEEVIACYKTFIGGLLDITDNLQANNIVNPPNVVRYDDDDSYLVVAADKGTATFSDIANAIAKEYDFWLGDAFASGGSSGYDHKKISITSRGVWESVKRHFHELDRDVTVEPFTVIGIGDMSGDVFGNGMLLSRNIRLVAAFNHAHIFLDPNPDAESSYAERQRLFNLPRSTWDDYNRELISIGGGVFSRAAKTIPLSPEIKALLQVEQDFMVPNDLIRAILKAEVDLLWNGGIGTYVKGAVESNQDVGDRANDAVRINGDELRCAVVGEGGNLGFTQLGRIEYAFHGGHIYTDFIDNSAGVDCSDHEVNIKIPLNDLMRSGDMTEKQRNELMVKMTDEVVSLVLQDNRDQTLAISLLFSQALNYADLHGRYIERLVQEGKLNRELEFLPDRKSLLERKTINKGLTRPEIAVLLAYSKSIIKKEILASDVPEDPYLASIVQTAFPKPLREKYHNQIQHHSLHREISATQLSNAIINETGFAFAYQLHDETGASVASIVRAYMVTRNIFDMPALWKRISHLEVKIAAEIELQVLWIHSRLVRRATRWFLRNRRSELDIATAVEFFGPHVSALRAKLPEILQGNSKAYYDDTNARYLEAGIPADLAQGVAGAHAMTSALDIIEAANTLGIDLIEVATVYFALGEFLELSWFRDQLAYHVVDDQWDALAKEALRDDLDWQQRGLCMGVLQHNTKHGSVKGKMEHWIEQHKALITRWQEMLLNIRSSGSSTFVMYSVAVRELMDLTQTSLQTARASKNKGHKVKSDA